MSFARKLSRAFNRTVTHGAFIAASVIMSAGTGYEVSNYLDGVQNAVAPQANVEMHNAAADKVNKMVQDITTSQERIDFSWTALQAAKENIGKNGGKIAEQLADVNAGFTAYEASRAEQMERLKTLRRELLFNPALSEKEATTLYEALWEQSTTGDYRNFFSPFKDAMAYRDETIARLHAPQSAAQATEADAERVVTAARAADDASDTNEWQKGLEGGIGTLGGLLSLSFLGARRKRREDAMPQAAVEDNTHKITLVIAPSQGYGSDTPAAHYGDKLPRGVRPSS
ncbi:MAG: hypothetical protein PW788_15975 [Micavibrio sp.]|nr:hypothetical protein [Micavibrio sp.]